MVQKRSSSDTWNLVQSYESIQNKEKRVKLCMSDGCSQLAVACWASNVNPEEPWNACESCQEVEFGGLPVGNTYEVGQSKSEIKIDCEEAENSTGEKREKVQISKQENDVGNFEDEHSTTATICTKITCEQNESVVVDEKNDDSLEEGKISEENSKNAPCENKTNDDLLLRSDEKSCLDKLFSFADEQKSEIITDTIIHNLDNQKKELQLEQSLCHDYQEDILVEWTEIEKSPIYLNIENIATESGPCSQKEILEMPPDCEIQIDQDVNNKDSKQVSFDDKPTEEKQDKNHDDKNVNLDNNEEICSNTKSVEGKCSNGDVMSIPKEVQKSLNEEIILNDKIGKSVTEESLNPHEADKILDVSCHLESAKIFPNDNEIEVLSEQELPSDNKSDSGEGTSVERVKNQLEEKCSTKTETEQPQKVAQVEKAQENTEEEFWTFNNLFSIKELRSQNALLCDTELCNLFACAYYTSSLDGSQWNSCLDCQENDYGGWPPIEEIIKPGVANGVSFSIPLSEEHKSVLTKLCSINDNAKMPQHIIEEEEDSDSNSISGDVWQKQNSSSLSTTPPPKANRHKSNTKNRKMSFVTPSPNQTLSLDNKRNETATENIRKKERLVQHTILDKDKEKKIIFDMLKDTFRPMNITQIYNLLDGAISSSVLKFCLDDITYDDNGENEDDTASNKNNVASDAYASTLLKKTGRNTSTTLYYIDYNAFSNNGNGLPPDERDELITAPQSSGMEEKELKKQLKKIEDQTKRLLSEPKNEEIDENIEKEEYQMYELEETLQSLQTNKVNINTKKKATKQIAAYSKHWKKRQNICREFLSLLEECTEGYIRVSECLSPTKNEGQEIDLTSDEYAINEAKIAAKAVRKGKLLLRDGGGGKKKRKFSSKHKSSNGSDEMMNPTETFIGVKLDSGGTITRVHLDDEAGEDNQSNKDDSGNKDTSSCEMMIVTNKPSDAFIGVKLSDAGRLTRVYLDDESEQSDSIVDDARILKNPLSDEDDSTSSDCIVGDREEFIIDEK